MIEARFRHRAIAHECTTDRHSSVIECLGAISWLWNSASSSEMRIVGNGESYVCDLTPFLNTGLSGAISYSARYPMGMTDKAMFDDVLTLEVDEKALDYREFSLSVFELVVSCFRCYRASIVHDLDLDLDDYDQVIEMSQSLRIDVDGRDSVFRVHPVNYFDEQLCQRAFRLGAAEVVQRLQNQVELVECVGDGVLVIVTGALVPRRELKGIHDLVASLLGVDVEVPV